MARVAEPVAAPDPATWLERTAYNAAMTARIVPYVVGLKHSQVEVAD